MGLAPGKVVVLAKTPGLLSVDGKAPDPLEGSRKELELSEGEHELRLEAEGYQSLSRTVKVVSGQSTDVELNLVPLAQAETPKDDGPKPIEEPTGSNRQLYGYIGVGAGAALLGVGVFSALQVNSVNNDSGFSTYRKGLAKNQDVCDEADRGTEVPGAPAPGDISDKCSTGATFQTMQFVFLGLGALATGAGLYFLLTGDSDAEKDAVQSKGPKVRTALGPRGGMVDLELSF